MALLDGTYFMTICEVNSVFVRNGKTHPIVHCGIDRNIITVLKLLGYGGRVIIIGWWYFVVVPGRKRKTRIES